MTAYLAAADPLIAADQTWILWAVIAMGVGLSIVMEQRYTWAARLSGPVLGLLIAMSLSSAGVMPVKAPVYDFIGDYLVPLAIPLLLFEADLMKILRGTGWMFAAFHLSVLGTVLGTVVAVLLFRGSFDFVPEIGGIMAASYSGGGVNFAAVKESFPEVPETLTNPLIVADNFIMAGMFMYLLLLSGQRFMQRAFRGGEEAVQRAKGEGAEDFWAAKEISLKDIALCLGIAGAVTAAGHAASEWGKAIFEKGVGAALFGNLFVWITAFSLVLATLGRGFMGKIRGAQELGSYALYVYLFSIGLPANLYEVFTNTLAIFWFCLVIALINLAVTLGGGLVFRLPLRDLLISVNATLGGAPSAVAMAVSKGWSDRCLPAMLVGIWGYVIGTALGVGVAEMLR